MQPGLRRKRPRQPSRQEHACSVIFACFAFLPLSQICYLAALAGSHSRSYATLQPRVSQFQTKLRFSRPTDRCNALRRCQQFCCLATHRACDRSRQEWQQSSYCTRLQLITQLLALSMRQGRTPAAPRIARRDIGSNRNLHRVGLFGSLEPPHRLLAWLRGVAT